MANQAAQTDIITAALTLCGKRNIAVNGRNDDASTAANNLYPIVRRGLLRDAGWNFARRWAQLNQLAAAPLNLAISTNDHGPGTVNFTSAYLLPTNLIRVYRFSPQDAHWRIVGNAIYTDAPPGPAVPGQLNGLQPLGADGTDNQPPSPTTVGTPVLIGIEYIADVTDATQFDNLFTECLTYKLASEICFAVNALPDMVDRLTQRYGQLLEDAKAVNGQENWPDKIYDLSVEDTRFGYVNVSLST